MWDRLGHRKHSEGRDDKEEGNETRGLGEHGDATDVLGRELVGRVLGETKLVVFDLFLYPAVQPTNLFMTWCKSSSKDQRIACTKVRITAFAHRHLTNMR